MTAPKSGPVLLVVGAVAAASGVIGVRQLQRVGGSASPSEDRSRWRSVTIFRRPDEVMPAGVVPAPLARLGDLVEVEMRPAPGSKGTELRARLRAPEPSGLKGAVVRVIGRDPRQQVRSALREAKQLIEVGEVLRLEPVPHGRRPSTPGGKLVELATRRAPGEGVL